MDKESGELLGAFLVRIGAMTTQQVGEVLERQRGEPNKLFGQLAIEMGFVDDEAIDRYIWGDEHRHE